MTDLHIPRHWRYRLLGVLDAPTYPENLRLLDAWQKAEGGTAQYNPLNTTYKLDGSWNYNTVGVQNYRTALDGICATAITIQFSYYEHIWTDLKAGVKTAEEIVNDNWSAFQTWGTNPQTILDVLKTT